MKESEFIELLNLYLDHEISAADATRLEAEVQGNPERRKLYQEYCRIQKACRVLATDFRTETTESAVSANAKVLEFKPLLANQATIRRNPKLIYYAAGTFVAIAACVAVVFINRGQPLSPVSPTVARSVPGPGITRTPIEAMPPLKHAGLAAAAVGATPDSRAGATMVSNPLLLSGNSRVDGVMSLSSHGSDDQLAWVASLQLAPLQRVRLDDLRFGTSPATLRPEGRPLGGSRHATDPSAEMSAFRFEK